MEGAGGLLGGSTCPNSSPMIGGVMGGTPTLPRAAGSPSLGSSVNTRHSACSEACGCVPPLREAGLCDSGYSELECCSCPSSNPCAGRCNALEDLPVTMEESTNKQTQ